jgi:hypothetical protein
MVAPLGSKVAVHKFGRLRLAPVVLNMRTMSQSSAILHIKGDDPGNRQDFASSDEMQDAGGFLEITINIK